MRTKSIILFIIALSFILAAVFLSGCQRATSNSTSITEDTSIKVTIMYPYDSGKTFDMEYYKVKHMPMLAELFGEALKKYEIDAGVSGRTPDDPIPFLAIGYLYFDSVSSYQKAFGPNAETILNDIPNYTNIQPVVQISEIIK